MKNREEKFLQVFSNVYMIILTILAVAPILLVLISSLTDNTALIHDGYSFFPK